MTGGLGAIRYAAANARTRGLYSRLLDEATWRELVAADGFEAAISLLRATTYGDIITAAEQSGTFSLEQIERGLAGRAAADCRRVMAFTNGRTRALLEVWWQHYELENLKALFRALDQNLAPNAIRRFLIPLGDDSILPWEALLHEHSVPSLVDRLHGTPYINPVRAALPVYQRDGSLFAIEIALDIRYYRDLALAIKNLAGTERAEASRILGTKLDMLNILWAFRYRVYYGLSAEEIVNYTLWQAVRTDASLVRDIALGAGPRSVLVRVWGEHAIDLSLFDGADGDGEARMVLKLELALQRYWWSLAKQELRGYPFRLGILLGYLVLRETEVRDLVTLLESKGMGWEPERTGEYLVAVKE